LPGASKEEFEELRR